MRIVNLIENTEGKSGCLFEHGLSFYVETANHKILIDAGQTNAFISNAQKLGIDLKEIDIVILSHGHYDHSGGLLEFANINQKAVIFMQKSAGQDYYHKSDSVEKYIGIDKRLINLAQVRFVEEDLVIDDELSIFSGVVGRILWPKGNLELMVKENNMFVQDDFRHEQYVVIKENDTTVLISGCAHNGVLNILEKYRALYKENPDVVISGFHMKKNGEYSEEERTVIVETAKELIATETKFYTGHCTGEEAYQIMKEHMGEQLVYVHSGDEISILNVNK